MTLAEFKAWFEGFTEEMEKPTAKQWARIKERVADIDGNPVTERIYVDRYWTYPWYPHWLRAYYSASSVASPTLATMNGAATGSTATVKVPAFDGYAAMSALGAADRAALLS